MAVTVWKGHLTFGLVSIPIRLFRAARREKIRFHQLYSTDQTQGLPVELEQGGQAISLPRVEQEDMPPVLRIRQGAFTREEQTPIPRSQVVKGYEIEKERYVTVAREEIEKITPKTSTEMEIL